MITSSGAFAITRSGGNERQNLIDGRRGSRSISQFEQTHTRTTMFRTTGFAALLTLTVAVGMPGSANASVSLVTSPGGLVNDGHIDWFDLGPNNTIVPQPVVVNVVPLGITATVSKTGSANDFFRV